MRNRQTRRSIPPTGDAAPAWDIAVPSRPLRLPGVTMAGFSDRAKEPVDLQVVPYPAVTLFIDLGDRLIAALAAGLAAGGEVSPVRSAGMVIAGSEPWPVTDLRVDWHEDPVGELAGLWARWQPQAESYVRRALRPSEMAG